MSCYSSMQKLRTNTLKIMMKTIKNHTKFRAVNNVHGWEM